MTQTLPTSLTAAAALLERRQISPVELVRGCLERIEAKNAEANAFITVMADSAEADAARAEAEIAHGRYLGPLHGIPVSIKDLIDVAGTPTTAGSAVPARTARHDAPVVANLRRAGAIVVGKTNLHEFAFGTTSDETAFGRIGNPYDPARSAGGSSGGAAVAIVEGMCLGSVGSDTGGSIRIPAAACGIVGLKPTVNELSCDGVVPLSPTLDHVGPMTRTAADAAAMFFAMIQGQNRGTIEPAPAQLRIGVPGPYFLEKLERGVREALARARGALEAARHRVEDVAIALAEHTPDVYLHISLPEAAWYHAPLLAQHAEAYSPGVRLRIEMGRTILAEDYVRAMHARTLLRASVDHALEGFDALLVPALAIPAPRFDERVVQVDGAAEPVRGMMLRLTQLFNITGHPAIALPAGRGEDGLPRGLQLVGHRGATARLLAVAMACEHQIAGGAGSVGGGTG